MGISGRSTSQNEEVFASMSIHGKAETLTSDALNLKSPNLKKVIRIGTRVKYAGNKWYEVYHLPDIESGNGTEAHKALQGLWQQRAITKAQYDTMLQAIYNAEKSTMGSSGYFK